MVWLRSCGMVAFISLAIIHATRADVSGNRSIDSAIKDNPDIYLDVVSALIVT